jgi:hypothetical protein
MLAPTRRYAAGARSLARRRSWWAVVGLVVGASGLGACSSPVEPWTRVDLPSGATPVTVTDHQGTLIVGALTDGRPAAVRRRPGPSGAWTSMTVTPVSAYGKEAEWLGIAVEPGGGLVAVGGARGGAHSNVRWSVWRGDTTSLSEQEQAFSTFGGWGAGEQLGPIATTAGSMLLGSWESARAALDADIWLPEGAVWVRQPAAGTALESTATELVGPRSGTAWGAGALVAGSVLHLGDGVRQTPAIWRSSTLNTGWERIDLPEGGTAGEGVSAACQTGQCIVAGWVDGQLAMWALEQSGARRLGGVPAIAVGDRAVVPAPILDDQGRVTLVLTDGGAVTVLRQAQTGWDRHPGPPGVVLATARVGSVLYAITRAPDGSRSLWEHAS